MKLSDKQLRRIVRSELIKEAQLNEKGDSILPWKFVIDGQEFKGLTGAQRKELHKAYKGQIKAAKKQLNDYKKANPEDKQMTKDLQKKIMAELVKSSKLRAKSFAADAEVSNYDELSAASSALESAADEALQDVKAKAKTELGVDLDEMTWKEVAKVTVLKQMEDGIVSTEQGGGEADAAAADVKPLTKILRRGSKSSKSGDVGKVQTLLNKIAKLQGMPEFSAGKVDGDFGSGTQKAVIAFQTMTFGKGSDEVDGKVGPNTFKQMVKSANLPAEDDLPAAKKDASEEPAADEGGAGGAGGALQESQAKKIDRFNLRKIMTQEIFKI